MSNKKLIYQIATAVAITFTATCDKVPDYCDNHVTYDPSYQFCFSGKAHKLCADGKYNPLTEGCDAQNKVGTRCADSTFVKLGLSCDGYTLAVGKAPENGGRVYVNNTARTGTTKIDAGTTVYALAVPEDGYHFTGWGGDAAEGVGGAGSSITINLTQGGMTLVANFKEGEGPVTPPIRRFTVSFNTNGGSPATISPITIDRGKAMGTLPMVTRIEYDFGGWFDAEGGQYDANTPINKNVTLTADSRGACRTRSCGAMG